MSTLGRNLRSFFLVAALVAAACAKGKTREEAPPMEPPAEESAATAEARASLETAEEQRKLESEYEEVMYRQTYNQAVAHRNRGEFTLALEKAEQALTYKPSSDEARNLADELRRTLGQRQGETRVVVEDMFEATKVRLEEQKVNIRAHIARARKSVETRDYDEAQRAYEDALFIVNTSPVRGDKELADLGATAENGLKEVERAKAEMDREQEKRDTERALREIADQQEKAELEARDRRARLLSAAIDRFNLEDFAAAEAYARQVLAEEPDNTLARDIEKNATQAQRIQMQERYLRDLKDTFTRWKIDIEESKVASADILKWPSQSYWDKITRLRQVKNLSGNGAQMSPEESNIDNLLRTRMVDLPFQELPFAQVVSYLTAASGVNFYVDPRAKDVLDPVSITLNVNNVSVHDAMTLIMQQASTDNSVTWEITGNVVRFLKKEHLKRNLVLQIHPVADLTLGLTDFIPPDITAVGVSDDTETPIFGGQADEAPQPYGTIEELMELVRNSVGADAWEGEGRTISPQGKNLVVYNTPEVQGRVAKFLDDLRAFSGIVVTIESRFLTVSDKFLRDVGVDIRGLGGTNGGPLSVLDDVTSGLDDNASAGIDNSGPGVGSGAAASPPSSGIFFNDGGDGDFRGRMENIFTSPLGRTLSALGGGTFQITYLDDIGLSLLLRAVEKNARFRELTAPSLTVYNTQRAHITVVNQISYVQDFDVEVAQTSFIADPVIGVIQDGLTLSVRPTVSNDRQYITLELRPKLVNLTTPIATFQTLLGAAIAVVSAQNPVTIQLPQLDIRIVESTVRIPDRGTVLLGGLKDISITDKKATSPILGNLPIINFLFKRQGKAEEVEHLMIVVTGTITDLQEQSANLRAG